MKIAIDLSIRISLDFCRGGITVFNRILFDSLLAAQSDLTIEFWCYENNIEQVLKTYKVLFDKYPKRVSLLTEVKRTNFKRWNSISIQQVTTALLRLCFALIMFRNRNIIYVLASELKQEFYVVRKNLKAQIHKSDADICFYSIAPSILNKDITYKGPHLFFIHDIFTIMLRDSFRNIRSCIDEDISDALANLDRYAVKGAFFTCYSNYIRDNQMLGWMPHLKKERVQAMKIPPIFKKFKDNAKIPAKKDFLRKFKIDGPYTPFASLIRPNKNVMLLLKAMKLLKDSSIELKLVTTGSFSGCFEEQAFISANNLDENIIETGVLSEAELYALYKYASIMIVTTRAEGPGIAQQCLEALHVGNIPVIHTKALGIEEALAQRGLSLKTADLNWVEWDNDKVMADKIKDALAYPEKHVDKQKNIISYFTSPSWDEVAKEFISIMEKEISQYKSQQEKLKK